MKKFSVNPIYLGGGLLKVQYPFEKYPAIKYKTYPDWKILDRFGEKEKM